MTYSARGATVVDDTGAVVVTLGSTSGAMIRAIELNAGNADSFEFTPSDSPDDYLVVEDRKKKTTWHLQVKVNGKNDHKLMGAAKASLTSPGGHRGKKYSGPNKADAIAKLKKMYEQEKMQFSSEATYLLNEFIATRPGEPYRLFPFGQVHKNGVVHNITPDYARTFHIPHFKPPIKLGSHAEATPAGGQITGLEVRGDGNCSACTAGTCKAHGLWAVPELVPNGEKALAEGHYRYNSPEVIWEDQGLEDPATGDLIAGPLIVGDALLHTPHLGEAAALYSIEPYNLEGGHMSTDENITMPRSVWDMLFGRNKQPPVQPPATPPAGEGNAEPPAPPPLIVAESEEYKAAVRERDELKARVEKIEAEAQRKARVDALVVQLQDKTKFGSVYIAMSEAATCAQMLDGMTEEQRAWVMKNFSAFIAQIKESNLTTEIGATGGGANTGTTDGTAASAFNVAVTARMAEKHQTYEQAFNALRAEQPALFEAYLKERK